LLALDHGLFVLAIERGFGIEEKALGHNTSDCGYPPNGVRLGPALLAPTLLVAASPRGATPLASDRIDPFTIRQPKCRKCQ